MKILDNIKNKINEIEKNNEDYQKILDNSNTIDNLQVLPNLDRKDISTEILESKNSNLTRDKARLIIDLIPIDESILEVLYTNELKTKIEYFIVPTTKYLWIISNSGYNRYNYGSLRVEIIKKNLLTRVINLSNFILEVSNIEEEVNNFISIINDLEYRTTLINNTNDKYGYNIKYKFINRIGNGISYDLDNNIWFFTNDISRKYNIKELDNYELLMDNNVMQEKRMKQNSRLTAGKNSCYEIKIRITPKDNNIFEIPILEKNSMSQLYQSTSDTYIKNLNDARKIMEVLDNINENSI